jgi:hypothetical protein
MFTPKQTSSKDGIEVQHERHPSPTSYWTLTTSSRRGIWTPNLAIQILACIFYPSNFVCVCMFVSKGHIHHVIQISTSYPNFTNPTFTTAKSSQILLKWWYFCFHTFNMELATTCKQPINTNVDDSGLKCPQHQGWYEISKLKIGMHPGAIEGTSLIRERSSLVTGEIFGHKIIRRDPRVCKSNRLHVDILRFSFIKLGYIL